MPAAHISVAAFRKRGKTDPTPNPRARHPAPPRARSPTRASHDRRYSKPPRARARTCDRQGRRKAVPGWSNDFARKTNSWSRGVAPPTSDDEDAGTDADSSSGDELRCTRRVWRLRFDRTMATFTAYNRRGDARSPVAAPTVRTEASSSSLPFGSYLRGVACCARRVRKLVGRRVTSNAHQKEDLQDTSTPVRTELSSSNSSAIDHNSTAIDPRGHRPAAYANFSSSARSWRVKSSLFSLSSQSSSHWFTSSASSSSAPHSARSKEGGRTTVRTLDLARVRFSRRGRRCGPGRGRSGVASRARLTFVAELLELVVALEVDGDLLLLLLLRTLGHGSRGRLRHDAVAARTSDLPSGLISWGAARAQTK